MHLAIIAYSNRPFDILGGIKSINQVAQRGRPKFTPQADSTADTADAFLLARDLLRQELPTLQGHPAPMICHLTDGQFAGNDPKPLAQEIMGMSNDDGMYWSRMFISAQSSLHNRFWTLKFGPEFSMYAS